MIEWCNQVVDHCDFDRESVAIAVSYLDRFLMTKSGVPALHDSNTFQLVAMTCLYTAIKLFESEVIDPKIVSQLSRGTYTEKDVTDMEMVILSALQWRVQPPTAVAFVRHFLALADLGERAKNLIIEVSGAQIENAITNYDFVGTKPSLVAAASILNTIRLMGRALLPDGSRCSLILALVEHGSNRLIYGKDMKETRDKLLNTVREKEVSNEQQSAACEVSSPSALKYFQENRAASPICVEKGPTYFMGSVASSFSNALQVGGQLWS